MKHSGLQGCPAMLCDLLGGAADVAFALATEGRP